MTRARDKPRILAAGTPPAFAMLRQALGGSAELITAETLSRAAWLLAAEVDLVVCTLRFDESRMFDFLRLAKAAAPEVPFVCCRVVDGPIASLAMEAVALAARSAGASAYVDLPDLHRRRGVEAGNATLRETLLTLARLRNPSDRTDFDLPVRERH